jgi:SAM-dependent methyltransferase
MIDRQAMKSAQAIADSIVRDFSPITVLDVGCGTGALLQSLALKKVQGVGLEYSEAALKYCRARSLDVRKFNLETEQSMQFDNSFDLVVSLEVAEHLPEQVADRFIDLLCRYGQAVIFTAAPPGQGGKGHLNEQPHEYWIEKFSQRSYNYDETLSMRWRTEWKQKGVSAWYSRNLMIFWAQ